MIYFCTLFDSNYGTRGLVMYNSLVKHCPKFHLFIVCLDKNLYNNLVLSEFDHITPIKLDDIERKYPELINAKDSRSYVEYIFTLSPVIALYVLEMFPEVDKITTLDADLYFFSDPTMLITENEPFSIGITPHDYKKTHLKHLKYGKYNVSFQTFQNNQIGIKCLQKWKTDCIDWCYDKLENNKFADQKYLDEWFSLYSNIIEYRNGSGIAPWNISNNDIFLNEDNRVFVKNSCLIYYHFHGVRNITNNIYSVGMSDYRILKRNKIIKYIYLNYIEDLSKLTLANARNKIPRTTHPKLGRLIFLIFIADLYVLRNGKLFRIYNLNLLRMVYQYFKSFF